MKNINLSSETNSMKAPFGIKNAINTAVAKPDCIPRNLLVDVGKAYPEAGKEVNTWRAVRGSNGFSNWPEWCYLPLDGWGTIASDNGENSELDVIKKTFILAAVGTWRVTQGIYRFDPTIYQAIINTPVEGVLPQELLYRLPEWCIYVETPGIEWKREPLHGFFAHLDFDTNDGSTNLRLLLVAEMDFLSIQIQLGHWTLAESITRTLNAVNIYNISNGLGAIPSSHIDALLSVAEPIVSLLLYICSQNSEIGDGTRVPTNPQPKRTKKGLCLFPPDKPTTWDVGVRMGSALRRAYHSEETGHGGTHAGPCPHFRRAHWHGFRCGAMKRADGTVIPVSERILSVQWLPPTAVNVKDPADLPATIRPVKDA